MCLKFLMACAGFIPKNGLCTQMVLEAGKTAYP
jgi:hypothetical protein